MSNQEKNAYILGTERAELHWLGLQHQVWASEARRGWEVFCAESCKSAGF